MQDTLEASAPQARALVLDWLASQQQAMQDLLQKVVNIDSGSRDEAGVTAVAHALAERLQAAGVPVQFEPVPGYGVLLHSCRFAFKGLDAAILQCIHGKQQRLNGPRAIRKITNNEIFYFLRFHHLK